MHHTLVRSLSVFSGNSLQKPRASVRFAGCSSYRPAYFGGLVYYPIGARHAFYTFAPSTPSTCPDAHSPTRPRITHSSLFRIIIAHGRDIRVGEGFRVCNVAGLFVISQSVRYYAQVRYATGLIGYLNRRLHRS